MPCSQYFHLQFFGISIHLIQFFQTNCSELQWYPVNCILRLVRSKILSQRCLQSEWTSFPNIISGCWGSLISGFMEQIPADHCWPHFPCSVPAVPIPPPPPITCLQSSPSSSPSAASSKHPLIPSAGSNLSFLQPPCFSSDTFTHTFTHTTLFFGHFPLLTFNFC